MLKTTYIAPALLENAIAIARVHVRSWQVAYAGILGQDFLAHLSVEERAQRWNDILERAETQTLVACQDDRVVGFVSFGRCRDEGAAPTQKAKSGPCTPILTSGARASVGPCWITQFGIFAPSDAPRSRSGSSAKISAESNSTKNSVSSPFRGAKS
jgi:hypothetical protein